MGAYILRRVLWVIVVLLVVTLITFIIFFLLPTGDPAVRFAGNGSAGQRIGTAIEIGGAALVMVLGMLLLGASLQA